MSSLYSKKSKSQSPIRYSFREPISEFERIMAQFKRDREKKLKERLNNVLKFDQEKYQKMLERGNSFNKMIRYARAMGIFQIPKISFVKFTKQQPATRSKSTMDLKRHQEIDPKFLRTSMNSSRELDRSVLPHISGTLANNSQKSFATWRYPSPFQPEEDMRKIRESRVSRIKERVSVPQAFFSTEVITSRYSPRHENDGSLSAEERDQGYQTGRQNMRTTSDVFGTEFQFRSTRQSCSPARMRSSYRISKRIITSENMPSEGIVPVYAFQQYKAERLKIERRREQQQEEENKTFLDPLGIEEVTEHSNILRRVLGNPKVTHSSKEVRRVYSNYPSSDQQSMRHSNSSTIINSKSIELRKMNPQIMCKRRVIDPRRTDFVYKIGSETLKLVPQDMMKKFAKERPEVRQTVTERIFERTSPDPSLGSLKDLEKSLDT